MGGLEMICRWEGEVLHPYNDIVGVQTIGIGHVIRSGENFPPAITHERALELLQQDVKIAEDAIGTHVKVPLTQNQFDALVSFTFNLGTGALSSSTLLKQLNAGKPDAAADEFLKWCKAGGKDNQGLLNRRKSERELFLRPDVSAPPVIAVTTPPTVPPVPEQVVDIPSPPGSIPPPPSAGGVMQTLLAFFSTFLGRRST